MSEVKALFRTSFCMKTSTKFYSNVVWPSVVGHWYQPSKLNTGILGQTGCAEIIRPALYVFFFHGGRHRVFPLKSPDVTVLARKLLGQCKTTMIFAQTFFTTVIAEIFARVKNSYSSLCGLSCAINFRTARAESHTLVYVHGFRMLQNFVF